MRPNYFIIPLVTIAVAALGGLITESGMLWYRTINLPQWTPPGIAISIAWTIIFILGTFSALIAYNVAESGKKLTWIMGLFMANAFLNVLWSYLFFSRHFIGLAFIEAIFLGASVITLIILIRPVFRTAATLLYPYGAWVIFATYLTYSVWRLN